MNNPIKASAFYLIYVVLMFATPVYGKVYSTEDLISPADGSTELIQPVTLAWDSYASALWYQVQVDDNPDFSSPEFTSNPSFATTEVSGLADETVYYWRTRFMHSTGNYSQWTDAWTFTVYQNRRWYVSATAGISGDGSYDNPFKDIKPTVGLAKDRDTVYIMNGVYTGIANRNISLNGKRLYIKGFSGPENNIIDLNTGQTVSSSAFYITDGEGIGTEIINLTIRNGYSTSGAISIAEGANPKITSCHFESNSGPGGAIRVYENSAATVAACEFKENSADEGGAINTASDVIVSNSIFNGNTANLGGAIRCTGAEIDVRSCSFYGNSAVSGGAIYIWQGTFNIDYCIFSFNLDGGAINRGGYYSPQNIHDCLFYENGGGNFNSIPVYEDQYNNIVGNPIFCNPGIDDFFISDNSPAAPANSPDGGLIGARPVGCTITDIADFDASLPDRFELEQNYPNPFNPETTISFAIPERCHVELSIYNILGRRVLKLIDTEFKGGVHRVTWDALNQPSGIYFYRLKTDKFVACRKMLLVN